ncbi:hypothetical protein Btru_069494 [Bulinus truncatus]|nr:hypothetical protein Btru_069494 [Bulinus truncatus]
MARRSVRIQGLAVEIPLQFTKLATVLQRNGPPESYQNFLNTHSSTYQGNNKQNLPLQSSALPVAEPVLSRSGYTAHSNNQNTSWTVIGVLSQETHKSPWLRGSTTGW